MSDSSDPIFDSELLDLHLGLLGAAQRDALRARIAADPKLTEQDAALAAVFLVYTRTKAAWLAVGVEAVCLGALWGWLKFKKWS